MTLNERLGSLPLGRFHWRLLLVMSLGWAFDAMDTGIISFALPILGKAWNLSPTEQGFIGSIGLVGMSLGAMMGGTIADYVGRKKVLAISLVVYGLGTGACGLSPTPEFMLFFRFIVGFGLGAQLPVAITLMSEYSPSAHRGRMIVLLESAWSFGWLAAAIIAFMVIPRYGWQVAFFIGTIPAVYVIVVWKYVPESALYLVRKGRLDEAHNIACKIEKELGVPSPSRESLTVHEASTAAFSFTELFSRKYLRRTVCLWLLWFGIVFSYYGIFLWLPSLLLKAGHDIVASFAFIIWITLAQIPGYFVAAVLVDRIGRKPTMVLFVLGTALAAYFFGNAQTTSDIYLWGCLMSFFNLGAWGILYTYSPELYPTEARTTGVGLAAAFGRVGGIVAPILVGYMLGQGGQEMIPIIFNMFTGVLVLVAINMIFLGEETNNRVLE